MDRTNTAIDAVEQSPLPAHRGIHYAYSRGGAAMTVRQAIHALQTEPDFRQLFNRTLAQAPYGAFRWETPPVTADSFDRAFAFVLIDSPDLDRRADATAFRASLSAAVDGVVVFPNLGGDALLVVPSPQVDHPAYGHLAAFVRHAPDAQKHALWQAVGTAMSRRVGSRPVWLNTAGAGVPWLHVRLDDRPKYYHYRPYAR